MMHEQTRLIPPLGLLMPERSLRFNVAASSLEGWAGLILFLLLRYRDRTDNKPTPTVNDIKTTCVQCRQTWLVASEWNWKWKSTFCGLESDTPVTFKYGNLTEKDPQVRVGLVLYTKFSTYKKNSSWRKSESYTSKRDSDNFMWQNFVPERKIGYNFNKNPFLKHVLLST